MIAAVLLLALVTLSSGSINVKSSFIEGDISDVMWSNKEVVHVRTKKGNVYQSRDEGASFKPFAPCSGIIECVHKITEIEYTELNTSVMLYAGASKSWLVDSGLTKDSVEIPHELHNIVPHPTKPKWFLAIKCTNIIFVFAVPKCSLFVSQDQGKTLDLISDNFYYGGPKAINTVWGTPSRKEFDENMVFYIEKIKGSFDKQMRSYDIKSGKSRDLLSDAVALTGRSEYLFAASLEGYNRASASTAMLHISPDSGVTWNAAKISSNLPSLTFTIADATEHVMFITIYHKQGSSWGTTYVSDRTAHWFSPALEFTHRDSQGKVDFHKVNSMEGVFIANLVSDARTNLGCQMCMMGECDQVCSYQTRVTYNKGHSWRPLDVPQGDLICAETTEQCSLHLHGTTTDDETHNTILSHAKSPGIILAAGNTGAQLNMGNEAVDLFMSRDAGVTWRKIKSGRWLFGFSDHGGLIVLAPHDLSNMIVYSLDEGKSWATFKYLDSDKVYVKQIIYNPHDVTSHVMILETVTSEGQGRLYRFDFGGLSIPDCQHMDNPSDPSSDYEWWVPKAYGSKCMMGQLKKYAVKKLGTKNICWDPVGSIRQVEVSNCECTMNDYECDYGFKESLTPDGEPVCVRDTDVALKDSKCVDGMQRLTRGYIKVAGNKCEGGKSLGVILRKCGSGWSFLGVLGTILLIALFFGSLVMGYKNLDTILEFVTNVMASGGGQYQPPDQNFNDDFGDELEGEEQATEYQGGPINSSEAQIPQNFADFESFPVDGVMDSPVQPRTVPRAPLPKVSINPLPPPPSAKRASPPSSPPPSTTITMPPTTTSPLDDINEEDPLADTQLDIPDAPALAANGDEAVDDDMPLEL